jgi:hypothetical protein
VFGPQSTAPSDCSTGGTTVGTASVSGDGTYHPSDGFTPGSAGDYWWYASYGGDSNNNSASTSCGVVETVVPDTSAPVISISTPEANAIFTRGQVVDADYSCTDPDGAADVASCTGPVPSGSPLPTKVVGVHTFTVTAADQAGHRSSRTHSYTVYAANGSGQMTVSPSTASASSAHHTLAFSYKAARGGIWHGELTLAVPPWWSIPSLSETAPGYVTASEGKVSVSGRTITVSMPSLASKHTLTITYGSTAHRGPGASDPSTIGTQTWKAEERSLPRGTLTNLAASPQIKVT